MNLFKNGGLKPERSIALLVLNLFELFNKFRFMLKEKNEEKVNMNRQQLIPRRALRLVDRLENRISTSVEGSPCFNNLSRSDRRQISRYGHWLPEINKRYENWVTSYNLL